MILEELVTTLGIEIDGDDLPGFTAGLAKATAGLGAIVAAGAAAVNAVGRVLDTVGEVTATKRFADSMGIAVESVQELNFAASQFGLSGSKIQSTLSSLRSATDGALTGRDLNARRTFGELGVGLTDGNGRPVTPDVLLRRIAARVAEGLSARDRSLFEGVNIDADVIRFLEIGPNGLDELARKGRALGVVFSRDAAESMVRFEVATANLEKTANAFLTRTALPLVEALADMAEGAASFVGSLSTGDLVEFAKRASPLVIVLDKMRPALRALAEVGKELAPIFAELAKPFETLLAFFERTDPIGRYFDSLADGARSVAQLLRGEGGALSDFLSSQGVDVSSLSSDSLRDRARSIAGAVERGGARAGAFGSEVAADVRALFSQLAPLLSGGGRVGPATINQTMNFNGANDAPSIGRRVRVVTEEAVAEAFRAGTSGAEN